MPDKAFTSFFTYVPHFVPDRDGYDQEAFRTGVLIRFYEDGTVDAVEAENVSDPETDAPPHFQGHWHEGQGKSIRFSLSRQRSADVIELDVPGDGSDYYAYPSSGQLRYLWDEGSYEAVCVKGELHVFGGRLFVMRRHGEGHPSLPCKENARDLNVDGRWATFASYDTEILQYNSDDEPKEVADNLYLRLHENGTVEVSEGLGDWNDVLGWGPPDLTGEWSRDEASGEIHFTIERMVEREPHQWWREMNAESYRAAVYESGLFLHRGAAGWRRGDTGQAWGTFIGITMPPWVPRVSDLPSAGPVDTDEDAATGPDAVDPEVHEGEARPEAGEQDATPDAADSGDEEEVDVSPGCAGCLGSVGLIVVALLIGRFLGGAPTIQSDDFVQLVPGEEHTLGIVMDGSRAYKGYHTVTSLGWEYEPLEGGELPLEVRVENTDPWVLDDDDVILFGPGNVPVPGQREDVVLDFVFRPDPGAVIGTRGVLYLNATFEYATWETGSAIASGVVGSDVDLFDEPGALEDQPVNVEVVAERRERTNVWQTLADWMTRLGALGVVLFGVIVARETWIEMKEEEEAATT